MKKFKIDFISMLFLINMLFAGAFFEYVSCLTSILLIGYLFYIFKKNGKLVFRENISSVAIGLLVLFYGLSCFWAVDAGMAFIGLFKFLPLLLFMLVLMQGEGKDALKHLPYWMAITTVITAVLMPFSPFKNIFSVAGRLAGTLQYPNTFAIVLLVSQMMLLKKEKRKIIDYICMLILLSGILLSGSRTVFVFTALFHVIYFIFSKNKKEKIIFFSCLIGAAALFIGFCVITDRTSLLKRYLSISVLESTFVGRLLYFYDAIPLVLKNPLGLGYLGYNYVQGTVQTGVYNVMYAHNDFLQIFLDAGWIAGILFIWATVRNAIKNENRIYLIALALHGMFDFSMQFIFVSMMLIYFFNFNEGKEKVLVSNKGLAYGVGTVTIIASLYIGLSLFLPYLGQTGLAYKMYPYNTQLSVRIMNAQNTLENANKIAQKILKVNQHEQNAYEIAARYSASNGDISSYIAYKRKSIELDKYNFTADMDYCETLMNCMVKYEESGDTRSYDICQKELYATVKRIRTSKKRLSKLGSMISEQPATYVPGGAMRYAGYEE